MNKLIIINHEPLTKKIEKNFMIQQYDRKYIDVEYWCVRNILYDSFSYELNGEITPNYYREIQNIKDLENKINNIEELKKTAIIVEMPDEINSIKIYKLLDKFNLELFTYEMYSGTSLGNDKVTLYNKIKKNIKNPVKLLIKKSKKIYFNHNINKYNVYKNRNRFSCLQSELNNNITYINNFDYEEYMSNTEEDIIMDRYCVFIDQYIPYHPDNRRWGNSIDAEIYYKKLEKFFSKIEEEYKIKVIIAEHPKANYDDKKHFEKFKRIKGKTCTLVKYSEFVFAHDSLSISFAILYNKPVINIYIDELKYMRYIITRINELSNILGTKTYSIDKDDIKELDYKKIHIDKNKYDNYKYRYLTSRYTEDKKNIDIVMEKLNDTIF